MLIDGAPLEAPAAPLHDLLAAGLAASPDEVAIVSADERMTWRELEEASLRLAGGYLALGLEPGDRVASLMPNRIGLAVHYLACFKAGLVATPLNYRYTPREIDHALEVSGAAALVAHAERGDDLAASALVGGLPHGIISFGGSRAPRDAPLESLLESRAGAASCAPPEPSSPAAIFFTSGSTGPAKGVTHSLETLRLDDGQRGRRPSSSPPSDTFLPGSSMSHIGSFLWTLASFVGRRPAWSSRAPSTPARSCRCCARTGRRCWR